jgi:hypothetical protein
MSQTPEQNLLSKLYECQDELERYTNSISIDDVKGGKRDLTYKTIMTLLITKKDMIELISKLETIICDKQELM